jgi:hypothetical protein
MKSLNELIQFLLKSMSMSEVYQPVIILYLLEHDGTASKAELARALSSYVDSPEANLEAILMRWPTLTLTKHEIITYHRHTELFHLRFELSEASLLAEAKQVCNRKISEWLDKRRSVVITKVPDACAVQHKSETTAKRERPIISPSPSSNFPTNRPKSIDDTKAKPQDNLGLPLSLTEALHRQGVWTFGDLANLPLGEVVRHSSFAGLSDDGWAKLFVRIRGRGYAVSLPWTKDS